MITTIYGGMDESLLEKRTPFEEVNGNKLQATEYYLDGELVHRSLNITPAQLNLAGEQSTIG
jgi:hypothetical protein